MNNNTLILHFNENLYFFPYCKKECNMHSVFKNIADKKWFKFLGKVNMQYPFLFTGWKRKVKKYSKVVIFDYGWEQDITRFIKKHNPKCSIHLFFFNSIFNDIQKKMLKDKYADHLWTFDPEDMKKYDLKFNTSFYTKNAVNILMSESIKWDIFFIGQPKGRKKIIESIDNECFKMGITTKFIVIDNEKEFIEYDECLKLLNKSKCILDITMSGQYGTTLRVMESLFFSKKLITNNFEVKKLSFYNPNNIFILGMDNIEALPDFISLPYSKPPQKEIDYYDVENWVKRFVD